MGNVVDLAQRQKPHASGVAHCMACKHNWAARVPLPRAFDFLTCPECTSRQGVFEGPFSPETGKHLWTCDCGSQIFNAIRGDKGTFYLFCPQCGDESSPRE